MSSAASADLADLPIRPELRAALDRAWARLAGAGTWWTGAQRLAMVEASRNALACDTCVEIATALSPFTVTRRHRSAGKLDHALVDVIHRVRTDSGRLTRSWFDKVTDQHLMDAQYAELVAVVATAAALDTFNHALGLALTALPAARAGEPTRHRPAGARRQIAWLPTLALADVTDADPDPYPGKTDQHIFHIHQALSLAPAEAAAFFDLDEPLYLPQAAIRDFDHDIRALSHAQMELVAARLSAINRCTY